ncbi:MAG TPA: hypothetical protein VKH42_16710 [Vicinamibacterales bacterium]|nr:hypothetical protein [Vicinamibacterales bacterium]
MVHALRRARGLLEGGGFIVDVHPTTERAHLELFTGTDVIRLAERIDDASPTGPRQRHAAADSAVASCVAAGELRQHRDVRFTFHTFADSVDELVTYLSLKWKQLRFEDADLARARAALVRMPGATLAVTERVIASKLSVDV